MSIIEFVLIALTFNMLLQSNLNSKVELNQSVLLEEVQSWRHAQGLPAYQTDFYLCGIADLRVSQIQNDFSHDQFRANALEWTNNSRFETISENLVRSFNTEQEAMNAWITSTSHLATLSDNYTNTCVRCEGTYCVEVFGK